MEEVRQLVEEEGREARNLIVYHVSVETPIVARLCKKPPKNIQPAANSIHTIPRRSANLSSVARMRSVSAGRDKKTELEARYWALLFGNLRIAVGEIYTTVETHENMSECQEAILVLENYIRDFKSLAEWFRLKSEYDNTAPLQRPLNFAWEIRKSDFSRPETKRANSIKTSPNMSGKNSPVISGRNTPSGSSSPNLMTGKLSPRAVANSHSVVKTNTESTENQCKTIKYTELKPNKEVNRLSDIKEAPVQPVIVEKPDNRKLDPLQHIKNDKFIETIDKTDSGMKKKLPLQSADTVANTDNLSKPLNIEILSETNNIKKDSTVQLASSETASGNCNSLLNAAKEDSKPAILDINAKQDQDQEEKSQCELVQNEHLSCDASGIESTNNSAVNKTKNDLEMMESEFLHRNMLLSAAKNENMVNESNIQEVDVSKTNEESVLKLVEKDKNGLSENINNKQLKTDSKLPVCSKNVIVDSKSIEAKKLADTKTSKPAYSQAAAKPIIESSKADSKTQTKLLGTLAKSKTYADIKHNNLKPVPLNRNMSTKSNTNRCSYPFNMASSRSTVFDSTPKYATKNKTSATTGSKSTQIKLQKNVEEKKPPVTKLQSIKDDEDFNSSDLMVDSNRLNNVEAGVSSETLVPEDENRNSNDSLPTKADESDGWLTVKSKRFGRENRKVKTKWNSRFYEPSATISLPTLNIMETPPQTKPASQPKLVNNSKKPINKNLRVATNAMIRQKSDVTELKSESTKKNKSKAHKNEDEKQDLVANRLHSSLESLIPSGLSRSQETTDTAFDFDKWRAEFKTTFKYFEDEDSMLNKTEFLKSADPLEVSEIAEMTSLIEENERKMSLALDFQSDFDTMKLCEEEDLLNMQIRELQQVSDIDIDIETDDTETDAEITCEEQLRVMLSEPKPLGPLAAELETQYKTALEGLSRAERIDTIANLEDLVARYPGRAQQLHEKLSQGIRRRGSLQETLRRYQTKQARAEHHRLELQNERTKKIQQLLARVEEVKMAKNQLIDEKRFRMERRLEKATENRHQHLKDIVRKAHDEEEKLKEIAFIKQLEAEQRRHDFLDQCRSHTARLRQMRRDRLSKLEQKAAREAAVGARKMALEAAREQHVKTLLEKRKLRDARVEELKEQTKQKRDDAAREKAEGVKSRLSALAAAAESDAAALRCKIRDKQDASQQRLATHLEAIRSRATLTRQHHTSESCDTVKDGSGDTELDSEVAKDNLKSLKKRCKKLKHRIILGGEAYENETKPIDLSPVASQIKISKTIAQLEILIKPLLINIPKVKLKDSDNDNSPRPENKNTEVKNSKKKKIAELSSTKIVPIEEATKDVANADADKQNTVADSQSDNIAAPASNRKRKSRESQRKVSASQSSHDGGSIDGIQKAESISSCSMSDMSRSSMKSKHSDSDTATIAQVEKSINELHRIMENLPPGASESQYFQCMNGIKLLADLFLLAVDKNEYSQRIPNRILRIAALILLKEVRSSQVSSFYFLNTNGCINAARLFFTIYEKEAIIEAKDEELLHLLCNLINTCFKAVHIIDNADAGFDGNETCVSALDENMIKAIKNRAHCLVGYLCCATRTLPFRSDVNSGLIFSFLSSCGYLCLPSIHDAGCERQSALQSFKAAVRWSMEPLRSALVSISNSERCELSLAVPTVALIKSIADNDHILLQEVVWSHYEAALEFKAAAAKIMSEFAPTYKKDTKPALMDLTPSKLIIVEQMVQDLVNIIGYFVLNNPKHQEMVVSCFGLLRSLCTLPVTWLTQHPRKEILLPTFAALADNETAVQQIREDMNLQLVEEFIEVCQPQRNPLVRLLQEHKGYIVLEPENDSSLKN